MKNTVYDHVSLTLQFFVIVGTSNSSHMLDFNPLANKLKFLIYGTPIFQQRIRHGKWKALPHPTPPYPECHLMYVICFELPPIGILTLFKARAIFGAVAGFGVLAILGVPAVLGILAVSCALVVYGCSVTLDGVTPPPSAPTRTISSGLR